MGNLDAVDLAREEDFEMFVSFAFIMFGKQASFFKIRDMIEEFFDDKNGEHLILSTASTVKLYVIKEKDYELLKELKGKH